MNLSNKTNLSWLEGHQGRYRSTLYSTTSQLVEVWRDVSQVCCSLKTFWGKYIYFNQCTGDPNGYVLFLWLRTASWICGEALFCCEKCGTVKTRRLCDAVETEK